MAERTEPWHPTHIHKKGGLYRFISYATHSETMEEVAVYENSRGELWVRPRAMFDEPDRFIPLPEGTRHVASFPLGTQFATWGAAAPPQGGDRRAAG